MQDARTSQQLRWLLRALAVSLGLASLWQVTEQDIFWQIRAGEELWQGHGFPQIDSWSFTAAGKPWWNVQWLSTMLFAALWRGGAAALVAARGVLVAALFWRAGELCLATLRTCSPARQLAITAALLPLTWTAMAFRLELRSDTLVFLVFVELLLRHARGTLRAWQIPAAVVLAANLHVGTAPFVALLAGTLALGLRGRTRVLTLLASGAALFVAPYHVRVLGFWWRHLFYASHTLMQNPDHQPLQPAFHFSFAFGLYGVCWLGLTLLAAFGFWLRWTATREDHAARREIALTFVVAALLTALCTNRIRIFPYQLLFLLPHLARSTDLALQLLGSRAPLGASVLAAFAFFVGVRQVSHSRLRYGFVLSRAMYPIGSAEFIQRERVTPNLFHTFAYGAYTVYALREYKDFVDTRETMFDGLQATILDAYASPEVTQQTMDRFGINATLVPIPRTERVGTLGFRNAIAEYLPQESWALVYFDDISVVVIRRIPEHAALIAAHEYQLLYPNLPPGNFLRMNPEGEQLARYRSEIATCLRDEPDNVFCTKTRERVDAYVAGAK